MKHRPALVLAVLCLAAALAAPRSPDSSAAERWQSSPSEGPEVVSIQQTERRDAGGSHKNAPQVVYLYGAPGSNEGTFETPAGNPDEQGWTGKDNTEGPIFWQVSTFNAGNLNGHGAGNHAIWCGQTALQQPTWATAPGYGNNWNTLLEWRSPAPDPQLSTQVDLEFFYNYDIMFFYDFFEVLWDSAGTFVTFLSIEGTNHDENDVFAAPGEFYENSWTAPPSSYIDEEIRILLRVTSDGAWSDQDGLFPTVAGAVQVDDIVVRFDGVPVDGGGDADGVATWENGDDEGWFPNLGDVVGDFSRILPQFSDIDPCATNATPQLAFIDDGTPPRNVPTSSTGGSTSPTWNYGTPGGWVVNYTGGLDEPFEGIDNWFVSPEIPWDLPGTNDDGIEAGAFLEFDVYGHNPALNGIFWQPHVRSDDGSGWTSWKSRGFIYYSDEPDTRRQRVELRDLLVDQPQRVQVALAVVDLSNEFFFPGDDSTPAPLYDNVRFARYSPGGPRLNVTSARFQDRFPETDSIDYALNPAELWVRMDAGEITGGHYEILSTDHVEANALSTVPGAELAGPPQLTARLFANPAFDAVRQVPSAFSSAGTDEDGWNVYAVTVTADSIADASSITPQGVLYAFDIPGDGPGRLIGFPQEPDEEKMFFPGDVLHYFFHAADTQGNVTSAPPDTTGYSQKGQYDRSFTTRALPSLLSDSKGGVVQPRILLVDDSGDGELETWLHDFKEIGLLEGVDFDVFTVVDPTTSRNNGIGGQPSHGATTTHLAGYDCLLYTSGGRVPSRTILGTTEDPIEDFQLLQDWHDLPGDRFAAYFGDHLAQGLSELGPTDAYLRDILGTNLVSSDVRPTIGGQIAPRIGPTPAAVSSFQAELVASAGCPSPVRFDQIEPSATSQAVASHEFLDSSGGSGGFAASAGIWHERTQLVGSTDYLRVDALFPFSLRSLRTAHADPSGRSAGAVFLAELLDAFGHPTGLATHGPAVIASLRLDQNQPNPFNPRTTISFDLTVAGPVELAVFDLRGRRLRTLLQGPLGAGHYDEIFDGRDDQGGELPSGVYLYRLTTPLGQEVRKMALIR